MGVDITFSVDHKLANTAMEAVAERLRPMDNLFAEVAQFYSLPMDPWRDAGRHNQGEAFYQTPAGFSILVGPAAANFHHLCRFKHFTRDAPTRTLLRRFAQRACQLLGGDHVLFAPDQGVGEKIFDWVWDGWSLAQIEAELLRTSPLAASFQELDARNQPPWTIPSYYVDRFEEAAT